MSEEPNEDGTLGREEVASMISDAVTNALATANQPDEEKRARAMIREEITAGVAEGVASALEAIKVAPASGEKTAGQPTSLREMIFGKEKSD